MTAPATFADLANGPEWDIIAAAFSRVSTDQGIINLFPVGIVLAEGIVKLPTLQPGQLICSASPVKPDQHPSERDTVYVDFVVAPVMDFNADQPFSVSTGYATKLYNYVRTLFFANILLGTNTMGQNVNIAVVDYEFRWNPVNFSTGYRIPEFRFRFQTDIDPTTGELA
jgi:hypothetical protein